MHMGPVSSGYSPMVTYFLHDASLVAHSDRAEPRKVCWNEGTRLQCREAGRSSLPAVGDVVYIRNNK